jgi:hypothetical protein
MDDVEPAILCMPPFHPQPLRKLMLNHHGNQGFKQISVLDLCDAIELLRVRRG